MNSQSNNEITEITEITYGRHFGHCRGICRNELIFSSDHIFHLAAGNDLKTFPETKKEIEKDQVLWKTLNASVNWNSFLASEERIGCPDCADGGSEYIEIKSLHGMKRVTIENGSEHAFLEPLLSKLRSAFETKIK